MLEKLKQEVYEANLELVKQGLVIYTWGNVSGIDREKGLVVIKPSGVSYEQMKASDMVVVSLESGEVVEGNLNPSSDTPTHLEIYRKFKDVLGIVHTHSLNAVAFAQAGLPIKALGTTHADYFYGDIPCTRELKKEEVENDYELNTGKVIVETFNNSKQKILDIPGVLVKNHGPFAFGRSPKEAVYHAKVMEVIAEMNLKTLLLNKNASLAEYVLDKHYLRKHGPKAYYGQKK